MTGLLNRASSVAPKCRWHRSYPQQGATELWGNHPNDLATKFSRAEVRGCTDGTHNKARPNEESAQVSCGEEKQEAW